MKKKIPALSSLIDAILAEQLAEIDSLNIKQPQLKLEVEEPLPPNPAAPSPAPATPAPAGTAAAPAIGDPTAPATGADPTTPGAPAPGMPGMPGMDQTGAAGGVPGGDPSDPNAPAGEEDPAAAGGGSGFGGFGGGGGGGGGGAGDVPGGGGEGGMEGPGAEGAGEEETKGDPIQGMVDTAQEMLNQTQDPSLILKSLKGQIQTLFQNPEHALGLVKALYDTNDSLLQSVAQRLWLFLKAESPKN